MTFLACIFCGMNRCDIHTGLCIFTLVCAGGLGPLDVVVTGDALLRLLSMNRCVLAMIHRWGRYIYISSQIIVLFLKGVVILEMLGWHLLARGCLDAVF